MNPIPFFLIVFIIIGVMAPRKDATDIRIERIRFDAPGTDARTNRSLNGEWVELGNRSARTRDLRGWRLSDTSGHAYVFDGLRLPPGGTVRVHTGSGRDGRTHRYWGRRAHVWDNSGSTVRLSSRSRVVDSCRWTSRGVVKDC